MSVRRMVLEYVAKHPGQTAMEIAKGLGRNVEDIGSTLTKQSHRGNLVRISGIGPRGGYGYFAAGAPIPPDLMGRDWTK